MHQRYIDYAAYNIWANQKLLKGLVAQNEALLNLELVGSFPTIRATMLHLWFAECGWLSRLKGQGWDTAKVDQFTGSNPALFEAWNATSVEFIEFIPTIDLEKTLDMDYKGATVSLPYREIIQTVFNHGSFHRGQIVMMMRQLGATQIPKTDYIEWVRECARAQMD